MIRGTIFSTADLHNGERYLYGTYRYRNTEFECELLYENEEERTTEVRKRDGGMLTVKTKHLYDLHDFKTKQW